MNYVQQIQKPLEDVILYAKKESGSFISRFFSSTCSANIVHLLLASTSILMFFYNNNDIDNKQYFLFLYDIIIIGFWSACIHLICKSGFEQMSWFFVFFPYTLLVLHLVGAVHIPKLFFNLIMSTVQQKIFDI